MKTFEQKEYMKAWLDKMTTLFPYSFFSYRCSPLSGMHIVVVQPEELLTNERFENEMIDLFDNFEFKYHAEVLCISPDDESYALLTDGGKTEYTTFSFLETTKRSYHITANNNMPLNVCRNHEEETARLLQK